MKDKPSYIISIYLDTNCINARGKDDALNRLEELYRNEKIIIETTDTLETELKEGKGYPKGIIKSMRYIFSYGPAVLGHSRVGSCIIGTEEDDRRLRRVLEIFFGGKDRPQYSKNEMRDAMHVATAIRYGTNYFVTKDKTLLRGMDQIKAEFHIAIVMPEECVRLVNDKLNHATED